MIIVHQEIDKMSTRLILLEQQISLLNSKNENQDKDMDSSSNNKSINCKEDETNLVFQLKSRLEDFEVKVISSISKEIEGLY